MTTQREQFSISLQSVIKSLDEITGRLDETRGRCKQILEGLQDESKLGAFSEFDFGHEELRKEGRKVEKELKAKLKEIEKQMKLMFEPMKVEQKRMASKMSDGLEGGSEKNKR